MIKILDIKIHNVAMKQTIKLIDQFIGTRKPHQIVTCNPEIIMATRNDKEYERIINNADLVLPDGAGLLWASRFLSKKPFDIAQGGHKNIKTLKQEDILAERVTGVDLIYNLARLSDKRRYSIFFLGAASGIAKKTSEILNKKYPNLKVAGYYSGKPRLRQPKTSRYQFPYNIRITDLKRGKIDPNWDIINRVRKAQPDILLVAYGHPKQEKFIARYKKALGVTVMIGVGGSFDFITGRTSRAPKILQFFWLEWLWRLLHQPYRFNRIITAVIRFPLAVIKCKLFK